MTLDRVEWPKKMWPTLNSQLRIHTQTQNFGIKTWWLLRTTLLEVN